MRDSKSPYNFGGGNAASSLVQSIKSIGEAFSARKANERRINDKMLDSEIRIRERAVGDTLRSTLKEKELKTAGKQERKVYKSQIKANVKAAERLTGTAKGQGVVKPGSKVSFGRERMDFTAKESPAAPKRTRTAAPKPSSAPKPAAKTPAKPATAPKSTPKAAAPKPAVRKAK